MTVQTRHSNCIAWYGLYLPLPEAWNLTFHQGNAAEGMLRFADLHSTRLELRWKNARKPGRQLDAMARRLERKGATRFAAPAGHRILHDGRTLLLAADARRLVELHWLDTRDYSSEIAAEFAANLESATGTTHWHWSVYGASGEVHRSARLKKISLLPGAARLEFTRGRCRATLGSWSMADRLLQSAPLREWAARHIPLIRTIPAGKWHARGSSEIFTLDRREGLLRRPTHHVLTLTHDPAHNRILFDQRSYAPGKERAC